MFTVLNWNGAFFALGFERRKTPVERHQQTAQFPLFSEGPTK
jgi:hypothetical protein